MGLWLEHRDEKGNLIDRGRFFGGRVIMANLVEYIDGGSTEVIPEFTLREAQELCKPSNGLPLERRDWVLRISFDDSP